MTEVPNSPSELDTLIEKLPQNFPAACEMIKSEIAPLLTVLDPGVYDHYVWIIKSRTKAASVHSVRQLLAIAMLDSERCEGEACQADSEVVELAQVIALEPDLLKIMIDTVNRFGVRGERRNIAVCQLVISSRLLPITSNGPEGLALKNSGQYGAGKSKVQSMCLNLHSKNSYYLVSDCSKKSLYYLEGRAKHKALVFAEAASLKGDSDISYAVRSLLSEGQFVYSVPEVIKGKRVTIEKRIEGPISLLTTTINSMLERQLEDRMFTIHPDPSSDQTKLINIQTAFAASGNFKPAIIDLKVWQYFHDSLTPCEVAIDFTDKIADFINSAETLPIALRRASIRVYSTIKTITLLYQRQRKKNRMGQLQAEMQDYYMAYQVIERAFAENLHDFEGPTKDRLQIINTEGKITVRNLASQCNVAVATISEWLQPLVKNGILNWCDKDCVGFKNESELNKAKHSGSAFLCIAEGTSLPTPFQLTGDPDWNEGGELYETYNLHLDKPGPDPIEVYKDQCQFDWIWGSFLEFDTTSAE
jgi:DNA primase